VHGSAIPIRPSAPRGRFPRSRLPYADPPLAPCLSRCVLPWIPVFGRSTPRVRLPSTNTPRSAPPHPLWCQESRTPLPTSHNRSQSPSPSPRRCVRALLPRAVASAISSSCRAVALALNMVCAAALAKSLPRGCRTCYHAPLAPNCVHKGFHAVAPL
jgi:hypothetical protein